MRSSIGAISARSPLQGLRPGDEGRDTVAALAGNPAEQDRVRRRLLTRVPVAAGLCIALAFAGAALADAGVAPPCSSGTRGSDAHNTITGPIVRVRSTAATGTTVCTARGVPTASTAARATTPSGADPERTNCTAGPETTSSAPPTELYCANSVDHPVYGPGQRGSTSFVQSESFGCVGWSTAVWDVTRLSDGVVLATVTAKFAPYIPIPSDTASTDAKPTFSWE